MASVFSSFLKKKVRDHLSLIDSALEIDTLLTRARATALHFFENRSLPPSIPLDLSLSLSSLSSSPSLACSSSSSGSASSCCNGDFASSSSFEKKSTSRSVKNQADGYTDRDDLGRDEEKEKEKEDEEEEERRDKKDGKREGERVKSEDEKSKERRKQKEEQEEIEKKKRDVKEKFDVEVYRQSTRLVSPLPVDQLEKFHQILHQILLLCRQQKAADALKRKEYALQQQKEDPKSKKTNLALSSSSFSSSLHASSRNGGVDTPYESRDHAKEAELERRRKQREREEQEKEEERKRQREKGGVCQALANHPYGLGVICASLHLQKSFLQDGDPHHHPATSSSFSLVDEKKKERIGGIVQDALEVLEILLTIMIPTLYKDIEERRNASLILKPDSCGVCTPEDGDEQGYGENEEDDEEEEESLLEEDEEGDSFFNVEDLLPLNRRSFFIAREKEVDPHRSRCWDKGESERRRRNVIEGIEEELERRRTKDLISEEDETMLLSGVYVHLLESVMSYTINGDLIVSLLLLPEVYIQHAALLILQKLYTSSDILHDIANSRISFYRKQRNLRHLLLHESTWISKSLLLNFSTAPSSTSLSPSSFHTPPSSSISRRDQDLFVREKEEKLKIERAIGVKKKGRLMCQCIETSFLNRPMCINRLTTSLQEDNDEEIKADFVRYEALEVLRILSTRNPDLQTIITFQGAIEALLSLLSSELSLDFYAPSQASSSSSSSHLHRYHVKAASQSSGVSPPSVSTLQMLLKSSRVRSILRCMYSLTKSSPVRKYVREANLLQPFLLLLEILLKAKDQQLKEIGRFSRKMERRFLIEEKCESPPSSFSRGVKFHRVFFDMLQGDLPVDGREEEKKRKREREGGKEKEEDRHVPGRNRGREGEDEKFSSHLFSSGVTSGVHTPHGVDASQDQEILSDLSSSLTSSTPLDISLSLVFAIFRHFFPVSSSLPRRSSSPSSRKIRTPVSACFSRLSPALSPSEKRRRRGRGRGAQEGEEEMKKKEKREGLANEVRSNQLVFLQHGALDLFSQQIAKISNTLAFFFYQNTSTNASLLSSSSSLSSSPCLSQKNGLFSSSSDPMAQEEIDGNLSMKTTTPLSPSLGGPQHHNEPLEGFPSSPPLSSFSPFSLGFFSYLLPGVLRLLTQLSQLFLAVIVSTTSLSSSSSSPPHSSEKKSDQEEAAFVDLVLSALLLPSSSPPGGGGGGEQDGSRGEQAMAPSSPPAAGSGGGGAVPPPLYCLVYTALQDGLSGSLHSLLLITLDTIITSFPQVQAHILLGTLETLHSAGLSSSSSSSSSSVSPSSLSASHPANSSSSSPVFLGSFDLFSSLPPLLLLRHASSSSSFSSPSPYLDGSHAGNISSVRTPHPTASIHIQAHSHSRRSSREVDEEEDLFELEPPALQILPPGVFIASLLQWLVTRSVHTAEKVSLYRAKQAGLLDMIYSSALQLNHLSSSSSASPLLLGTDESISHDRDEREGDTKEGIKTPRDHVDEKIHERDVQISLIERQQNLKNDQFERRIRISQAIRALQLLYLCLIDNEDLRVLFSCSYLLPSLCPFFSLRNQDPHLPLSSSSSPLQTSLSTQVQSVGNDTIKKTSINTRYVSSNEGQKRERKEEESLSKHLSSPSSFSPLHEEYQSLLYQLLLYLLPSLCRCIFFYSEKQFLRQRPSKEKRKRYEKKNDKDRDVGEGEEGMIDEEVKEEEEDFYLYSALLSHLLNLLLSFYPTTPSKTERRPRGISFSQQKTRNSRRNEALFEERKISKNRPPPQIMKVAREKQEPPSSRILMSLYSSSSLWNQEGGTEKKRSSSSPIHFLPLGLSWLLTSGLILPSLLLLSLLFSHDEGRPKSPVSSSCTDSEGDVYEVNERRDTALGVAISTRRKQEKKRKKRRKKKKMDVFRCLHVGDSLFILQGSISLLFDRILSVFHTWERRLEEDEEERLSLYEEDRRSPFFRSFFFSQTPAINAGVSLYRSSGGRHLNREDLGSPSFFRRIDRERKEQEKEIDDLEESRTLQRNGGVSDSMRENKKKKKERSHELAARISERERPSERQDQEGEEEERVKNGDAISSSSFLDDIRKRREDTEDLILDIIGADKTALQTINLLNSQIFAFSVDLPFAISPSLDLSRRKERVLSFSLSGSSRGKKEEENERDSSSFFLSKFSLSTCPPSCVGQRYLETWRERKDISMKCLMRQPQTIPSFLSFFFSSDREEGEEDEGENQEMDDEEVGEKKTKTAGRDRGGRRRSRGEGREQGEDEKESESEEEQERRKRGRRPEEEEGKNEEIMMKLSDFYTFLFSLKWLENLSLFFLLPRETNLLQNFSEGIEERCLYTLTHALGRRRRRRRRGGDEEEDEKDEEVLDQQYVKEYLLFQQETLDELRQANTRMMSRLLRLQSFINPEKERLFSQMWKDLQALHADNDTLRVKNRDLLDRLKSERQISSRQLAEHQSQLESIVLAFSQLEEDLQNRDDEVNRLRASLETEKLVVENLKKSQGREEEEEEMDIHSSSLSSSSSFHEGEKEKRASLRTMIEKMSRDTQTALAQKDQELQDLKKKHEDLLQLLDFLSRQVPECLQYLCSLDDLPCRYTREYRQLIAATTDMPLPSSSSSSPSSSLQQGKTEESSGVCTPQQVNPVFSSSHPSSSISTSRRSSREDLPSSSFAMDSSSLPSPFSSSTQDRRSSNLPHSVQMVKEEKDTYHDVTREKMNLDKEHKEEEHREKDEEEEEEASHGLSESFEGERMKGVYFARMKEEKEGEREEKEDADISHTRVMSRGEENLTLIGRPILPESGHPGVSTESRRPGVAKRRTEEEEKEEEEDFSPMRSKTDEKQERREGLATYKKTYDEEKIRSHEEEEEEEENEVNYLSAIRTRRSEEEEEMKKRSLFDKHGGETSYYYEDSVAGSASYRRNNKEEEEGRSKEDTSESEKERQQAHVKEVNERDKKKEEEEERQEGGAKRGVYDQEKEEMGGGNTPQALTKVDAVEEDNRQGLLGGRLRRFFWGDRSCSQEKVSRLNKAKKEKEEEEELQKKRDERMKISSSSEVAGISFNSSSSSHTGRKDQQAEEEEKRHADLPPVQSVSSSPPPYHVNVSSSSFGEDDYPSHSQLLPHEEKMSSTGVERGADASSVNDRFEKNRRGEDTSQPLSCEIQEKEDEVMRKRIEEMESYSLSFEKSPSLLDNRFLYDSHNSSDTRGVVSKKGVSRGEIIENKTSVSPSEYKQSTQGDEFVYSMEKEREKQESSVHPRNSSHTSLNHSQVDALPASSIAEVRARNSQAAGSDGDGSSQHIGEEASIVSMLPEDQGLLTTRGVMHDGMPQGGVYTPEESVNTTMTTNGFHSSKNMMEDKNGERSEERPVEGEILSQDPTNRNHYHTRETSSQSLSSSSPASSSDPSATSFTMSYEDYCRMLEQVDESKLSPDQLAEWRAYRMQCDQYFSFYLHQQQSSQAYAPADSYPSNTTNYPYHFSS